MGWKVVLLSCGSVIWSIISYISSKKKIIIIGYRISCCFFRVDFRARKFHRYKCMPPNPSPPAPPITAPPFHSCAPFFLLRKRSREVHWLCRRILLHLLLLPLIRFFIPATLFFVLRANPERCLSCAAVPFFTCSYRSTAFSFLRPSSSSFSESISFLLLFNRLFLALEEGLWTGDHLFFIFWCAYIFPVYLLRECSSRWCFCASLYCCAVRHFHCSSSVLFGYCGFSLLLVGIDVLMHTI